MTNVVTHCWQEPRLSKAGLQPGASVLHLQPECCPMPLSSLWLRMFISHLSYLWGRATAPQLGLCSPESFVGICLEHGFPYCNRWASHFGQRMKKGLYLGTLVAWDMLRPKLPLFKIQNVKFRLLICKCWCCLRSTVVYFKVPFVVFAVLIYNF